MAVLKDYCCPKHGEFESREAKCPMKGCETDVYVLFKKAPGLKSDATKNTDKTVNQLAIDFNMTDIKSTREGDNQAGFFTRNNTTSPAELAKDPGKDDSPCRLSLERILLAQFRKSAKSALPLTTVDCMSEPSGSVVREHHGCSRIRSEIGRTV